LEQFNGGEAVIAEVRRLRAAAEHYRGDAEHNGEHWVRAERKAEAAEAERDALRAVIQAVEKVRDEWQATHTNNGPDHLATPPGFCECIGCRLTAALAAAGVDREDTEQPQLDDELEAMKRNNARLMAQLAAANRQIREGAVREVAATLGERPHRPMSAEGPEQVLWAKDGTRDYVLRQVGWIGQSGAFYSLDEDPALTKRGGFSPLLFIAHSDAREVGDTGQADEPQRDDVHCVLPNYHDGDCATERDRQRCNCFTYGSARLCPVHTQDDYEAADRAQIDTATADAELRLMAIRAVLESDPDPGDLATLIRIAWNQGVAHTQYGRPQRGPGQVGQDTTGEQQQ
jgi:hypothetical protein